MVDLIVVGADRIAANGDTNKIGIYSLAVLAKEHNIPMYIAAPLSTIDMSLTSGKEIPIEERKQMKCFLSRETNCSEGTRVLIPHLMLHQMN